MIVIAGYIKLYRDLRNNEIWKEKPFTRGQAWVDLLFSANHEDKKIIFDGNLLEIKRGSFITSVRKLSESWGWSRTKTVKFLNVLQIDEMILKNSDEKKTLITIINWDLYQVCEDNKKPQKSHRKATEKPQKDTNNNDKELIKNDKEVFITSQHLSMTKEEYEKLTSEFGQDLVDLKIDYSRNYAKLKSYNSLYLTLNNWLKADKKKEKDIETKQSSNPFKRYLQKEGQI